MADPFAGSGFANLAKAEGGYDPRGSESLPYDLNNFLEDLGPSAQAHSLLQAEQLLRVELFGPGGPLNYYATALPDVAESALNPTVPVDESSFFKVRAQYLRSSTTSWTATASTRSCCRRRPRSPENCTPAASRLDHRVWRSTSRAYRG